MVNNYIGQIVGVIVTGIVHAALSPYKIARSVYEFFANGARYLWLDYLYMALGLYWLGLVVRKFQHYGFAVESFWTLVFCGLGLAALIAVSEWIKKIPAGSPLSFIGWIPAMPWASAPLQTWSGVNGSDNGKAVVRGAQVLDGQSAAQQMRAASKGVDLSLNIEWGGVPLDAKNEAEHFLISGKTGAGKTQAINSMLRTVRARQQPAIIADPAGGYLQRFGRDGEYILNPFDSRDAGWSPFTELEADYDCPRMAKAAIPDGSGDSKEWHFYAQSLFGEVLRSQWKADKHSVKELLRLVMAADVKELQGVLADTPAAILTAKGNEKMLSNTRAIAATYLNVWSYLPDEGKFSVRRWVREVGAQQHDKWLYLTYQDNQMAMLRNLVATWLELAIVEGLSLSEEPSRRVWYIMDELDSLGRVSSLRAGLTKLRKYGGVCVNGLQTIAQLRDTYGKEEAQTLLSCMSTKLLLAAGDAETAEYFSQEIGEREITRDKISTGTSTQTMQFGGSTSENRSTEHATERAVMPSEITALPNLHGFLKPVGRPVMRITLAYVPMDNQNAAFTPKGA